MFGLTQHYIILGIDPTATPKEVKSAYFRLARQYHPDKVKEPIAESVSFVNIRNAYEAINADILRKRTEQSRSKKIHTMANRLNTLINILIESD
jgi:DnaJ-class molecular chaperone